MWMFAADAAAASPEQPEGSAQPAGVRAVPPTLEGASGPGLQGTPSSWPQPIGPFPHYGRRRRHARRSVQVAREMNAGAT